MFVLLIGLSYCFHNQIHKDLHKIAIFFLHILKIYLDWVVLIQYSKETYKKALKYKQKPKQQNETKTPIKLWCGQS